MASFPERLRGLRAELRLTQGELAQILNLSRGAIAGWEGEKGSPDPKTLSVLADYFHVSVDYLLGRVDNRPVYEPSTTIEPELDVLLRNKSLEKLPPEAQREIAGFIKYVKATKEHQKNNK